MVKTDLERVGIPYVTADGVTDFHVAGRHTHITEMMRTGALVTEHCEGELSDGLAARRVSERGIWWH